MNLVIVESPTKAKTIQRFLPADFVVRSSFGHIRDLPAKKLGVDVKNDFDPQYVVSIPARKKLTEIKKVLPKAKKVILASDEDREGEAIAWHLTQALNIDGKEVERIVFHEITKKAIGEALKHPRELDMNLVDAQQARRILDRLVGYELSPFLWRKVAKGLSAGRVQSVAVRLIVEREREIKNFKSEEYWTIDALLKKQKAGDEFLASLIKKNNKNIPKLGIKNEKGARSIVDELKEADYQIAAIARKDTQKHPAPPFVTSTLQQEAVKKLGFSAKQTMQIAQQLYEGVVIGKETHGLITYMRTDSLNLAQEAVGQICSHIESKFGKNYVQSRIYKTKTKGAQEAHEAIRPTDIEQEPEQIKKYLTPHQFKLYDLIWKRTLACQMAPAVLDTMAVDIEAKTQKVILKDSNDKQNSYLFRANGSRIKFEGFLKLYAGRVKENILPDLKEKDILDLIKLIPSQHFTEPPPRYSESSLIKALEQLGIGRPSTYAPIISTIQERNYAAKDENKKFAPTDIGFTVNDILVKHFPQIVDLKFTVRMEEDLDEIARGKKKRVPVIKEFYEPFKANLNQKYEEVKKQKQEPVPTDRLCPKCGSPLVIRTSRFGQFFACSKFPECRFTESIVNDTGVTCPKCLEGKLIEKRTKKGKIFYACSRYPECEFALWDKPTGQKCPHCGSLITMNKQDKEKCSNKECSGRKKNENEKEQI